MDPRGFLNQTCSKQSLTGRDAYGQSSWGTLTAFKARVQPARRVIKAPNGVDVSTTAVLYSATAILLTDRIFLPGADTASKDAARLPIQVDVNVDRLGVPVMWKAWFG